jgi:hypothetical protein
VARPFLFGIGIAVRQAVNFSELLMRSRAARMVPLVAAIALAMCSATTPAQASREPVATAAPQDLKGSFQAFCDEWMQKLRARELYNLAHIQWETSAEGTRGTYVGYSEDHTCTLTTGRPPIGKISYRETHYEKRGQTISEAEQSPPQPIEIFDTSELFTYINGKWDY